MKNEMNGIEQIRNLARDAFIFFYPLIETVRVKSIQLSVFCPINKFHHRKRLTKAKDREVVAPNNDTLYSSAFLDLKEEPLVLSVPDTKGRYYLMPFMDAWTNNFHNIGFCKTGTEAGNYVIKGPDWKGDMPKNLPCIDSPTNLVWIIGRTLVDGEEDLPAAIEIMEQYVLTPLSEFLQGKIDDNDLTEFTKSKIDVLDYSKTPMAYWEKVGDLIVDNRLLESDKDYFSKFEKLGITENGFDPSVLSKEYIEALKQAVIETPQYLGHLRLKHRLTSTINNWLVDMHGRITDDYTTRAQVAFHGLGRPNPEEAVFFFAATDQNGEKLTGRNKYVLHFNKDNYPPVRAFWSLTLYDYFDRKSFFYDNPLNRYSIGDRTPGLVKNEDGSMDIYVQHEKPDDLKVLSNWLPAPTDKFGLTLRLFCPLPSVLKDEYEVPHVVKTE
jgi:hypothetical protein